MLAEKISHGVLNDIPSLRAGSMAVPFALPPSMPLTLPTVKAFSSSELPTNTVAAANSCAVNPRISLKTRRVVGSLVMVRTRSWRVTLVNPSVSANAKYAGLAATHSLRANAHRRNLARGLEGRLGVPWLNKQLGVRLFRIALVDAGPKQCERPNSQRSQPHQPFRRGSCGSYPD